MTIQLRIVAPIFTGGIKAESECIHATGILGSLRWWYEALVRGFGGRACDPSTAECVYGEDEPDAGICEACRVFGATGWKRRFRLGLLAGGSSPETFPPGARGGVWEFTTTGPRLGRDRRPSRHYFRPGQAGTFALTIAPVGRQGGDSEFARQAVVLAMKLIEKRAALGAKPQLGYGRIEITQPPSLDLDVVLDKLAERCKKQPGRSDGKPSLAEMFFTDVVPQPANINAGATHPEIQTLLNLKYDIRKEFAGAREEALRHFVCGTSRGHRAASKIAISRVVGQSLRVWGWIPESLPSGLNGTSRETIAGRLYGAINAFGKITDWREFLSQGPGGRDRRTYKDSKDFLKQLLV
jgi:CRISPR-associated protein Cmr1